MIWDENLVNKSDGDRYGVNDEMTLGTQWLRVWLC